MYPFIGGRHWGHYVPIMRRRYGDKYVAIRKAVGEAPM